jgi:hypothetical protein
MILYKFNRIGPPYWLMIKWCKANAPGHKFTRNSITVITGVWLHEEDAIAFKLRFANNEHFI